MKRIAIAAGILAAVAAFAGIGLPLYESKVEQAITDWAHSESQRDPENTLTFESINVDIWTSTVVVTDAELSGPFSVIRVERLSFEIDSPFLLLPRDRISRATLFNVEITDPASRTSLSFQTITVDNLSGYGLFADTDLRPAIEILDDLTVETIVARDGIIKEQTTSIHSASQIEIGALTYADIVDGRVGRMTVSDLSLETEKGQISVPSAELLDFGLTGLFATLGQSGPPGHSAQILSQYSDVGLAQIRLQNLSLTTSTGTSAFLDSVRFERGEEGHFTFQGEGLVLTGPTGIATIQSSTLSDFDLDGMMMHIVETNAEPITPGHLIETLENSSFHLAGLTIDHRDGSRLEVGSLLVSGLSQEGGIPTAFTIEVEDAIQTSLASAASLDPSQPFSWNLPDALGGKARLTYSADMAEDTVHVELDSWDRFLDLKVRLHFSLSNTSEVLRNFSEATPSDRVEWNRLALAGLDLSIDTVQSLEPPDPQQSPPPFRAYLISLIQRTMLPPELEEVFSAPVIGFLYEGGQIDFEVAPNTPLSMFQIQDLSELPPNLILSVTGLNISHRIYGTN